MDQNAVIPIFSGASNWLRDNNSASCNEYRSREETGTLLLAACRATRHAFLAPTTLLRDRGEL